MIRAVPTRWLPLLLSAAALLGGCASRSATSPTPAPTALQVRIDTTEAAAALAIARQARSGGAVAEAEWDRLFRSEGYRRLQRREAAIRRPFTDSSFRAFVLSDSLGRAAGALTTTLDAWSAADVSGAARLALAYLPAGTVLRATVYPMVKPRDNSFVFETGTDSAAIFLYLDPQVSRAQLENTMAHELHHIGYARACAETPPDSTAAPGVREALRWLGAFGEGVAMLAAAGGPDRDPHAASDSAERARWQHDLANVGPDLRRVERFLLDVADGRLTAPDSIRAQAMTFFGDAQGPWYTIGYTMAATIERAEGRRALVDVLCDPRRLLSAYDRAAAAAGGAVPRWSPALLAKLAPGTR